VVSFAEKKFKSTVGRVHPSECIPPSNPRHQAGTRRRNNLLPVPNWPPKFRVRWIPFGNNPQIPRPFPPSNEPPSPSPPTRSTDLCLPRNLPAHQIPSCLLREEIAKFDCPGQRISWPAYMCAPPPPSSILAPRVQRIVRKFRSKVAPPRTLPKLCPGGTPGLGTTRFGFAKESLMKSGNWASPHGPRRQPRRYFGFPFFRNKSWGPNVPDRILFFFANLHLYTLSNQLICPAVFSENKMAGRVPPRKNSLELNRTNLPPFGTIHPQWHWTLNLVPSRTAESALTSGPIPIFRESLLVRRQTSDGSLPPASVREKFVATAGPIRPSAVPAANIPLPRPRGKCHGPSREFNLLRSFTNCRAAHAGLA